MKLEMKLVLYAPNSTSFSLLLSLDQVFQPKLAATWSCQNSVALKAVSFCITQSIKARMIRIANEIHDTETKEELCVETCIENWKLTKFPSIIYSPSWFDDTTNIMKNRQWFFSAWQNSKIAQESLYRNRDEIQKKCNRQSLYASS